MSAQKPDAIGNELSSQATLNLILDPDSSAAIMRRMMSDKPEHRASALRAAATTGSRDPRLLEFLLIRVEDERVPELRASLVRVIGALGSVRELPQIARFLQEEDPQVRANAVEALEMLRAPPAFAIIIKTLADPHPRVRTAVIAVLHRLGKTNILKCCQAMLVSAEAWMREAATLCLAATRYPEAVPLFEIALTDAEAPVRQRALAGLKQLADAGDTAALRALQNRSGIEPAPPPENVPADLPAAPAPMLQSSDVRERRRAAGALAILGADEAQVPVLLEQLAAETDEASIASLLVSLGRSRLASAVQPLCERLTHPSERVRAAAIRALCEHGDRDSSSRIVPLARDGSVDVASKAILAIEASHSAESQAALEQMARSPDAGRRRAAALVASEARSLALRAILDLLVRDPDNEVANAAREAREMTGPAIGGEPEAPAPAEAPPPPPAPPKPRVTGTVGVVSRTDGSGSGAWKRPTQKVPVATPPPEGFLAHVKSSPALAAAFGASLLVIGAIAVALVRDGGQPRTAPAPRRSGGPASEIATIATASDPSRFVGRVVRWTGSVKEVGGDRDRLMVETAGHYFAARCDMAAPPEVKVGSRVEVDGLILECSQGVVILKGRTVRLAEAGKR